MYTEKELIKKLADLFVFMHNEPYNCKPGRWKRFIHSLHSKEDIEIAEMDAMFEVMRLKVANIINLIAGKDLKLKTGFLTKNIKTTKIIEIVDNK